MEFDFRPVKAGPIHFMGRHDEIFMEFAILEAGLTAAQEGYDAVCVDTTSDSSVAVALDARYSRDRNGPVGNALFAHACQ